MKFFFGTLRVNGDGAGKPKAKDLHKALSVYGAKSVGERYPAKGRRQGHKIVYIPHRVKAYHKIMHKNLLRLYKRPAFMYNMIA